MQIPSAITPLKQNSKEVWYNNWTTETKGRSLYKFQNKPNPKDPICNLERRDQCNISRSDWAYNAKWPQEQNRPSVSSNV